MVNSPSPSDPSTKLARELHDRINSFVQTGASTSVAHTLTEDCKTFFQENSSADHQDFYVTYQLLNHFLLGYYRAFFQDPAAADKSLYKFQAEVQAYHRSWETKYRRLTKEIDHLTEKLRLETIAREKEALERQTAEVVAQGLKDELQAQESWWHWKYEELRVKYASLQAENSESKGAQKQTVAEQFGPFVEFDEKDDSIPMDNRAESNPLNLPLTFPKIWDEFAEDPKTSSQPPPYDHVGCLSIISTPMLKDGSLHDESQMKELLLDLLTDPSMTCQRILGTSSAGSSSTGLPSSSSRRPPPSPNCRPILPARRSTVSSAAPTLPPPQPSRPNEPAPVRSQPDVPLWTRKRSLLNTPYTRDVKGKTAGTVVTRSLSASEAE